MITLRDMIRGVLEVNFQKDNIIEEGSKKARIFENGLDFMTRPLIKSINEINNPIIPPKRIVNHKLFFLLDILSSYKIL